MNAILKEHKKDIFEIRKDVIKRQNEAAKDPSHSSNDGLRAYLEERKRKLELLRNGQKKAKTDE